MNIHWLLRAKRWAQNPPSAKRVRFILGIIIVCLVLVAIERWFGWPDALTVDRVPRRIPR